jgi:transposase
MAKPLVDDGLWQRIQVLVPAPKPRRSRYPGRKPIDDRKALTGILFVLKMGIPWEELPQEMGCGSGMTCWRRLQHWQQTGAWYPMQQLLTAEWREAERIDWARVSRDTRLVTENGVHANNDSELGERNGAFAPTTPSQATNGAGAALQTKQPFPLLLGTASDTHVIPSGDFASVASVCQTL